MSKLLATAAAVVLFAGAASADEPFVLGAAELDGVTAGAGFTTVNDIDLAVDKVANIDLMVNKTVDASFTGDNVLADAEAFADASGFDNLLAETLTVTQVEGGPDGLLAAAFSQSISGGSND